MQHKIAWPSGSSWCPQKGPSSSDEPVMSHHKGPTTGWLRWMASDHSIQRLRLDDVCLGGCSAENPISKEMEAQNATGCLVCQDCVEADLHLDDYVARQGFLRCQSNFGPHGSYKLQAKQRQAMPRASNVKYAHHQPVACIAFFLRCGSTRP